MKHIVLTFGAGRRPLEAALRPHVLLAATTGVAASAIEGSTLHSLLFIEVQHGREGVFGGLMGDKMSSLQNLFQEVKLLICDEYSMASNILLLKMHQRLCEIKQNSELFGGVNVLLFGDILQACLALFHISIGSAAACQGALLLQNRAETPPYEHFRWCQPRFEHLERQLRLRVSFEHQCRALYRELVQNMRQRGDSAYAKLLDLVRIGSPDAQSLDALCQCMISERLNRGESVNAVVISYNCVAPHVYGQFPRPSDMEEAVQYYLNLRRSDEKTVALFGRNVDTDYFNERVVQLLSPEVIELQAQESQPMYLLQKYLFCLGC